MQEFPLANIPLDPGNGGRSILPDALNPGDLILSTTNGFGSEAIRALTGGGPASHVRLYIGTDTTGSPAIIEAVPGAGVTLSDLAGDLAGDSLAVAFRRPGITDESARAAVDYAKEQLGVAYNYFGVIRQFLARYASAVDLVVNLGAQDNQTAYCSQLVTNTFIQAQLPLTLTNPAFNSPDDIVQLDWFGELEYVGHLKY